MKFGFFTKTVDRTPVVKCEYAPFLRWPEVSVSVSVDCSFLFRSSHCFIGVQ